MIKLAHTKTKNNRIYSYELYSNKYCRCYEMQKSFQEKNVVSLTVSLTGNLHYSLKSSLYFLENW